jgi:flagellar motor component MotA
MFGISIGWLLAFFQVLVIVVGHPELGVNRYTWILLVIMVGLLGAVFHRFSKKADKFRI